MKTGFIGLGAMGAPMASNLHAGGWLTAVWNRSPQPASALAARTGCEIASDPADLAARCELVVICVSGDADVLAVIDAMTPALGAEHIVVDCSTIAADSAREAARRVEASGAAFLDCPVSGGVEGARQGRLAIMVGGDEEALARCRSVLEAMAASIVHMGPSGNGQATKAVNQIMAAGINQAVSEAMAFARAEGLAPGQVIEALGGGAASSWFLNNRGPYMAREDFPPGFRIALHDKDLAICQTMAEAHGVQLPVVEMTRLHYRRLISAGHGDEDISALYRLKRQMFDNPPHPPRRDNEGQA